MGAGEQSGGVMSWPKVLRFFADLHYAIASGLDVAANLVDEDKHREVPK